MPAIDHLPPGTPRCMRLVFASTPLCDRCTRQRGHDGPHVGRHHEWGTKPDGSGYLKRLPVPMAIYVGGERVGSGTVTFYSPGAPLRDT